MKRDYKIDKKLDEEFNGKREVRFRKVNRRSIDKANKKVFKALDEYLGEK